MTFENQPTFSQPSYSKAQLKLIKATLDSLMKGGIEGCSVRKICQNANMAVGLVNYHIGTLHDLLAAAYLDLANSLMDGAIAKSRTTNVPRQKLTNFIQETFSGSVMQKDTLRAWIVFWSLIESSPQIKQAHDISNRAFRAFLEQCFSQIQTTHTIKPNPQLAAIGLTAMIDGLWLEWCLSSNTFSTKEAILLCEQWVDAAC